MITGPSTKITNLGALKIVRMQKRKEKLSDEKKKIPVLMLALVMAFCLATCGESPSKGQENTPVAERVTESAAPDSEELPDPSDAAPLELEEIPEEYPGISAHPGSVVRIDYETNTYDESNRSMDKYAYVYLPYGYDEGDDETRYNIFYVMHCRFLAG